MFPFLSYPKIAERMAAWSSERTWLEAPKHLTWVANEKIHGAHLCIAANDHEVRVGKRRAWLDATDQFFDYRAAAGPMLNRARALLRGLQQPGGPRDRKAVSVWVYGELYGGAYPHPDVPRCQDVNAIQTGVFYTPSMAFAAFDVAFVDADGTRHFLCGRDAEARLIDVGIPVAPRVATGPLNELLELPCTFSTRVPDMHQLPRIEENWAEGLILKPWDQDIALDGKYSRPLIKRKHPAFAETRFHEARAWSLPAPPDALNQAERELERRLTNARTDSAISKQGTPTPSTRAPIARELATDALDHLVEDCGALWLALLPDERALLEAVALDRADELVAARMRAERDPVLDPSRYHRDLALAFIRGRLSIDDDEEALVEKGRDAELSLHKFKIKDGPPRVQRVLSELRGIAAATLLDIGSGRGAFLWPLLSAFPAMRVTATDLLSHRVRDIQAVHDGGIARLQAVETDVTALPFDDDAFDVVTILEVLEHLDDPTPAAAEVLRVARGHVLASVPSRPDNNPEHVRLFSSASLTSLFLEAGAQHVTIRHVRGHMIGVIR